MNSTEVGEIAVALSILLAGVHILGRVFERLGQPKLVGELLTGVLLGPGLLGRIAPGVSDMFGGTGSSGVVMDFIHWLGLLLLMFCSGCEARWLLTRRDLREVGWLVGVGTPLPFIIVLGAGWAGWLPLDRLASGAGMESPTLLVLAIGVAVTSIPVISRIFFDLRIIDTRFAGLILSVAVVEDIVLWGVLAVAAALAGSAAGGATGLAGSVTEHIAINVAFMVAGLTLAPALLRRLNRTRWNLLARVSPVGYVLFVLFAYTGVAVAMDVSPVFAAFLAGYAVIGGAGEEERKPLAQAIDAVTRLAFGFFVPIYFAQVGYKLALRGSISLDLTVGFLVASSVLSLGRGVVGAWLAGFRRLDLVNIAVALNARGGPGIVLASVAYDAGIINQAFYGALVVTAVVTSQAAGVWLRYVLRKGWPLLAGSAQPSGGGAAVPERARG